MSEILIIDVGGTKTNLSFVGLNNSKVEIFSSDIFPTSSSPEQVIHKISDIYASKKKSINHMSLSLPGRWDENGILKESFFLHDWLEYPFIKNLANELQIKNYTWETDVICGALGEYHVLETRDKSMLYINLGTGIGAAFIKDGKPFKSKDKLTLRMQKLVIPFQDELYGGVDLISGGNLLRAANCQSIEELYKDYKSSKVEAINIISSSQNQLAAWLINLFYLFAPDLIVLNGGLTYDWEVLALGAVDIACEELEDQLQIIPSKLKEQAPIYGAYFNFKNLKLKV